MSYLGNRPGRPKKSISIQSLPKPHRRIRLYSFLFALCLSMLLFADTQNAWPLGVSQQVYASAATSSPSVVSTAQDFLKMGNPSTKQSSSSFVRPSTIPAVPATTKAAQAQKPPPSAEPPTMTAQAYQLDSSFIVNQSLAPVAPATKAATRAIPATVNAAVIPTGSTPFKITGSDGRLEVQLPRTSVDIAAATVDSGTAPVGGLILQMSQHAGHYVSQSNFLGTYIMQLVDSQGHLVHGVHLKQPLTIIYHYQPQEIINLDLDVNHISLSWPDALVAARAAKQSTTDLVVSMKNNPTAHTLTAQTSVVAGMATVSGTPEIQTPAKPVLFSVADNSGQISYSYPIAVPPGPGGFAPKLQLTYSSESTNERYSARAPASAAGEGWNLGLASISKVHYPASSTAGDSDWYFLSGVDNVSDRLVPDTQAGTGYYQTEHISHLRIHFNNNCWQVWDTSGTYYEIGCSPNEIQYTTDASNNQQIYQWNVGRILAPYESPSQVKTMLISYLQETPNNGKTIRDAGIKQILYGYATSTGDTTLTQAGDVLAGTVDFHYHSPEAQSPWADAYGNNACNWGNPPAGVTTTLRCDDPGTFGTITPPDVMSTLSLDSVTSYVGNDSSLTNAAFRYDLSHLDAFGNICYDSYSLIEEYCAGQHLLSGVKPTVYQNGTAHAKPPLSLSYTANPLQDVYYDPNNTTSDPHQQYGGQTWWRYLSGYSDLATGVGENVSYGTAFSNTNGTPYVTNADGTIDDRHDPLYCWRHANDNDTSKQCIGVYVHPESMAWSRQVVIQMQAHGTDSSASSLALATTTYNYWLARTGTGCHGITGSGVPAAENDCVGDNWIPGYNGTPTQHGDSDWIDYDHAEFRGFNAAFVTSPAGNLTANYYFSTEGWGGPQSDGGNYNSGQLYQQDVYQGSVATSSALLQETVNSYTGVAGPFSSVNSCNGKLNATYNPCIAVPLRTRTALYEGTGTSNSNAPWTQTDYTYDDVNETQGFTNASPSYHNLLQAVTTSSNAPAFTKKWTYQIDDQTAGGDVYYNVNKVSHSEVDDANGHVWQCQDTAYDEGRPGGIPVPAAGWPTTTTTHTDCSSAANQASSAISSYAAYDQYGNAVASVDAFGVANSALYSTKGCTLSSTPTILSPAWTQSHYTACTTYDTAHGSVLPVSTQNVLGQTSSTAYDYTQGGLPISATDANGQTASTSYSYDSNGNATVQVKQPGALSSYSGQATSISTCTTTSTLPCHEVDSNNALYAGAVTRTFYDNMGQAVETRTPLDATHDTIVFTVHDAAHNLLFQSVSFRVPTGTGWLDPNSAHDEGGGSPGGTITYSDALGRPVAVRDPIVVSSGGPGVGCPNLSGSWNTCIGYGLGNANGDSTVYHYATTTDSNSHLSASFTDALGRTRYSQLYSTGSSISSNITKQTQTQYNVLGKPTAVIVTDLAPQPGQTITSVTTSSSYDDTGRLTAVSDPDRGTHTYTYDANGSILTDISGIRTIGTSYDLLGRVGCVQDAVPTTDGSGTCSSGSHPLTQNTYDISELGTVGSTDFPIGNLTQSISTTYYPDGTSSSTIEKSQHDLRGRITTDLMQITVPSSWNTTLPTYQKTQNYNDDNQLMTTQTTVGGSPGYTFSQAYDGTTGVLAGISNNTTGAYNLASQGYNMYGLVGDVNFQSTTGSTIANDHFNVDQDLRTTGNVATWNATSSPFFSKSLAYDPVGNVISTTTTESVVSGQSVSGGSETENFCYDEENRLIWSGNSGTEPGAGNGTCGTAANQNSINGANYSSSFAYNHLDQIWQGPLINSGVSQQYLYCDSAHPHQLTGVYPNGTTCATRSGATASYNASYDSWGNETTRTYSGTTATLSYDVLDELAQWNVSSSNQAWYAYGADGVRTMARTITSSGTSLTVYAFGLEEHVYNGSGSNVSNTYYYTLGGRLVGKFDGTTTQYYLTDAQGSVLSTFSNTVNTTTVLGNQVYGPYGNTLASSGSMGTAKGYTGQYNDATGLDYYNARFYDPVVGLFLSVDTIQGNQQGMDPYAYVKDNPETLTDPTGRHAGPILWPGPFSWPTIGVAALWPFALPLAIIVGSLILMNAIAHSPAYNPPRTGAVPVPVPTPTTHSTAAAAVAVTAATLAQARTDAQARAAEECPYCKGGVDLDIMSSDLKGGHTQIKHIFPDAAGSQNFANDDSSGRNGLFGPLDNKGAAYAIAQGSVYLAVAFGKSYRQGMKTTYTYDTGLPVGNVYITGRADPVPTTKVTVVISSLTCSVETAYPSL